MPKKSFFSPGGSKLIPRFMLIVWTWPFARPSASDATSITDRNAWTLTLKRTGPSAEAALLGRYARSPLMTTLLRVFGKAPVMNEPSAAFVTQVGSVAPLILQASAEPFDLKPVSAIGLSVTVLITPSLAVEMTVTRPSL